ncbi:aminoglycoside phosphotransferase family protein [Streptomyces sp. NPDC008238]
MQPHQPIATPIGSDRLTAAERLRVLVKAVDTYQALVVSRAVAPRVWRTRTCCRTSLTSPEGGTVGDTIRRPAQSWTPTVHALLRHLESVGFPYAPRPLGFDEQGREVLTFIHGESGPQGWAKVVEDQGLSAFAQLLRDYHDATAGFSPPAEATWSDSSIAPSEGEVICHGDFGPWNVVWQGNRPVEIIDWDFARLAPRMHDVAYALHYVAAFRDDAECLRWWHRAARPPPASGALLHGLRSHHHRWGRGCSDRQATGGHPSRAPAGVPRARVADSPPPGATRRVARAGRSSGSRGAVTHAG